MIPSTTFHVCPARTGDQRSACSLKLSPSTPATVRAIPLSSCFSNGPGLRKSTLLALGYEPPLLPSGFEDATLGYLLSPSLQELLLRLSCSQTHRHELHLHSLFHFTILDTSLTATKRLGTTCTPLHQAGQPSQKPNRASTQARSQTIQLVSVASSHPNCMLNRASQLPPSNPPTLADCAASYRTASGPRARHPGQARRRKHPTGSPMGDSRLLSRSTLVPVD
jgi:hypothetical protein